MLGAVRRLGAAVFVPDHPAEIRGPGWVLASLGGLLLGVVAAVRASSTPITTTMWAEDGRIFLADALEHGPFRTLLRGYNGYSHFVPRLIADVTAAVPAPQAALVMGVVAVACVGLIAVFCARASTGHIRTRSGRLAYAALFVLLPIAGVEVLGNIANLHWFLLVAAFWAVVWRPGEVRNVTLACGVVALAALSDPLTAFLVPLVLWRLATVTSWRDRAVALAFMAALAVEAVVVLRSESAGVAASFRPTLRLFEQRVAVGSLFGVEGTAEFVDRFGGAGVHIAFVVIAAAAVLLWWRYGGGERPFVAVSLVGAAGLFVLCVGLRGAGDAQEFISGAVAGGSRYTVAPVLIALGGLIVLFERADARAVALGAALATVLCVVDFRVPTLRGGEITWARGLAQAQTQCRFGVDPSRIPILPVSTSDDWFVPAACSYVSP